jgi:SAM-dependent methyltransferase
LPFVDDAFATASLLDVLEHVSDDGALLGEIRRVVRPGGAVVVTVPARHRWSFLDPDDALFRFPRVHRAAWSLRFGRAGYGERFAVDARGIIGDIALVRGGHTNYGADDLRERFRVAGLEVEEISGSGRFFRPWQLGALMLPGAAGRAFDAGLRRDGRRTTSPLQASTRPANLFVVASVPT